MNLALDVLDRWSCYGYCLLTDLSNAYRSIRMKPRTNSVRRFYWFRVPEDVNTLTEFMVCRCNFGERVLDLCNLKISDDTQISEPTREFLKDATYVDDGATSTQHMAIVEIIANELGPLYHKYSFKLKYCLKNYAGCVEFCQ